MSGLSHTPGKRARGKTLRGFESRLIRQKTNSPVAPCVTGLFLWSFCQLLRLRQLGHLHGRANKGGYFSHVARHNQGGGCIGSNLGIGVDSLLRNF